MIFFLGCDVSKSKLDVSFVNEQGVEAWYDVVPNNVSELASFLLSVQGNYPTDTIRCAVESTGTYHYPLLEACQIAQVPCRVMNPIITKGAIRGTVRGKKTDKTDALLIAQLGLRGEGWYHTPEPFMATKHYARSCQKLSILSGSFQQYKNHLSALLDGQLSPEAVEVLKDIQQAIADARKQLHKDLAASANGPLFTRLQTIPGTP